MHKLKSLENHHFHLNFQQPIKFIKEGNDYLLIVNNYGELFINGLEKIYNKSKNHFFEITGMKDQFVKINEINNVKLIGCGYKHAVIINELNEIFIFGNINIKDKYLQKVDNNYIYKVSIKNLTKNPQFKKAICGFDSIILVTKENILYVAGVNEYSQLGCESKKEIRSFTKIDTEQNINIIDVQCGDDHTLILDELGHVYGSGLNKHYTLCDSNIKQLLQFTKLNVPFSVKRISCLSRASLFLSTNNDFYISNTGNFLEKITKILPNIKINYIYSSYVNSSIYLVTENGNCYRSESYNLDFTNTMEREDSGKDLRYFTVLPGNGVMVYSDYLINNEDIGDCKEIKLFKGKLIDCSLQNRVTDISFLF